MFIALDIIKYLAYLAIIVAVLAYLYQRYQDSQPQRQHKARKQRLGDSTYSPDEEEEGYVEPTEATRLSLAFANVAGVQAGQTLMKLPTVDALSEKATTTDRTVLAVGRAIVYPKQGKEIYDLLWTDGGYLTGVIGGRPCVFHRLNLSDRELGLVEKERQQAVDKGDLTMQNLLGDGRNWEIKWAMGSNPNASGPNSSVQITSVSPLLKDQAGFSSPVSPALLDGVSHDYFDVLAVNGTDDEIFYAFYAGMNGWHAFVGRKLNEGEVKEIIAV